VSRVSAAKWLHAFFPQVECKRAIDSRGYVCKRRSFQNTDVITSLIGGGALLVKEKQYVASLASEG
jgi:hypothetical protein